MTRFLLQQILPDGSHGERVEVPAEGMLTGRGGDWTLLNQDPFVDTEHVLLTPEGETLWVEDKQSLNGIFRRIGESKVLSDRDIFRVGQQILQFRRISTEPPTALSDGTFPMGSSLGRAWGQLTQVTGPEIFGEQFLLLDQEVTLGREHADICFAYDGYLSGRHASLKRHDMGCLLSDCGSSNGTFIRIQGREAMRDGCQFVLGMKLFRIIAA